MLLCVGCVLCFVSLCVGSCYARGVVSCWFYLGCCCIGVVGLLCVVIAFVLLLFSLSCCVLFVVLLGYVLIRVVVVVCFV